MPMGPIEPAFLVHVRRDGDCWPGELRAWRRQDGTWQGYVMFTEGVGMTHVGWVDQNQLRPG
jgi:hypothetical protein